MSGPKGATYQVVSPAELERRALVQALAALADAREHAAVVAAEVRAARAAYGRSVTAAEVPAVDPDDTSTSCAESAAELVRWAVQAATRLQNEVSTARSQALLAAATMRRSARAEARAAQREADLANASVVRTWEEVEVSADSAVADAGHSARVARALDLLATSDDVARGRIEQRAAEALAAEGARAGLLARALQDDVLTENRAERARVAQRERLVAIRTSVLGRADDACAALADEIQHLLAASGTDADLDALERRANAAAAAATVEADRRFAVETAIACLTDLGYEVASGFETVVADGGVTYLSRARWPGYSVQFRIGERPELGFNVVRDADSSSSLERDREIETEWCSDYARVQDESAKRGVRLQLTRHTDPGEVPVQVVTADVARTSRRAVRSRLQQRAVRER